MSLSPNLIIGTAFLALALNSCETVSLPLLGGGDSSGDPIVEASPVGSSSIATSSEDTGTMADGSSLAQPDFQKVAMEKKLDRSLLSKPSGEYRVGPGDLLDIEVAEDDSTRAQVRVMPDGMLHYNVAEGIQVRGRSTREISKQLSFLLKEDYINPIVTVNVEEADSQRFYLLGQVKKPGVYPIQKPTTLIGAISQGGGLLSNRNGVDVTNPESADLRRASLIRHGEIIPVDFHRLIKEGDLGQNVYIQPGDYIFIPSLVKRSVYVLGEVARPGPVFYEEGATVLSCVAAAGGAKPNAHINKALILRGSHHDPDVAVVNLRAIMKGWDPDLMLAGGDIIWVPKTAWTTLARYTEGVLTTAAQAVAVQEGLGVLGTVGSAGITITAGGN
ncbi:MAG: SLBB domain-containing protein [Verrucomicrobiota bacterium]